ncbi:MAG: nuclear transport factor 2 family protein [Acidobacteriota bacterium]
MSIGKKGQILLAALLVAALSTIPSFSAPSSSSTDTAIDQAPATVDLPPELARVLTDYEAAWRARDPQGLAALFTEDGYVLSHGRPPVVGRKAITERYKGSGGDLYLRAFRYQTSGDIGYILGGYTYTEGGEDNGKFTLTLERDSDGHWLIVSDMDNSNRSR